MSDFNPESESESHKKMRTPHPCQRGLQWARKPDVPAKMGQMANLLVDQDIELNSDIFVN